VRICKGIWRNGLLLASLALGAGCASSGTELRVLSFEVGCSEHQECPWEEAKAGAVEAIRTLRPDLLAMQGASPEAVAYLRGELADYTCAACGADEAPGFAVFWRSDRVERFAGGFIAKAAAESPAGAAAGDGEKRKDAAATPFASWGHFRIKADDGGEGAEILLVNVHMGSRPAAERDDLAQALRLWLRGKTERTSFAMTGGFHDTPLSRAFYTLTEADLRRKVFASAMGGSAPPFLVDAWSEAEKRRGPNFTFQAGPAGEVARLDWILVPPGIRVLRAETVRIAPAGAEASGHYPVLVDLRLPPPGGA